MNIVVKQPTQEVLHDQVGLVLVNHLGSTVTQDTGRDAQLFADELGLTVVAVDRPGTHGLIPSRKLRERLSTPSGYVEEMWDKGLEINHELKEHGIEKTVIAGRSAAGLGALAMTVSGAIQSQKALVVAEPIGCEKLTIAQAKQRFKDYNAMQESLQNSDPNIIRPQSNRLPFGQRMSRLGHMAFDFYYDQFHNGYIWASEAGLEYAGDIRADHPVIDTTIEFAEHSLVIQPEKFDQLNVLNADLQDELHSFVVRRSANTTHASYNDYRYMATLLEPVVSRVAAS